MCVHAAEVRRQPNAAKSPRNQSSVKEIFIQKFSVFTFVDVSERETRENAWRKRTENARLLTVVLARAPKLMHAYNPLLDEVSHGAKQTKVWEEYKAERTARETENVDDEAAGSDSRYCTVEKKAYGKHYSKRLDEGPSRRRVQS